MSDLQVDVGLLERFEAGFDPRHPERSVIPARVLGYGEISTVLAIAAEGGEGLACKRLAMFRSWEEVDAYEALYWRYVRALEDQVGIRVVPSALVRVANQDRGRIIVYIVQEQLPRETIGHRVIHHLSPPDVRRLVRAVLREGSKVFRFNQAHPGGLELGLDMQISNWALVCVNAQRPELGDLIELRYLDTSTPLARIGGIEQLEPELFLRSAPFFLVWILRLLFLEDVLTRYYDARQVTVDLLANFYKEQRPELVPGLVETVNEFFAEEMGTNGGSRLVTEQEVRAYYREDAWIWRLYLAFRKVDRGLHGLAGKRYPYVLPEEIRR